MGQRDFSVQEDLANAIRGVIATYLQGHELSIQEIIGNLHCIAFELCQSAWDNSDDDDREFHESPSNDEA